ncbi:MAG: ABC transporter substrate-binding protein [Desulfobulbaceae bacterium]|nr:ABC transporter substrate-binding protein [Desulfobulbaceae bacterium]
MNLAQIAGKKFVIALLLLFFMVAGLQVATGSALGPLEQVKESVDAIMSIVKDNKPKVEGEKLADSFRQQIMDIVYERFDFRAMSRLALARYWKTITPQEQDHFVFLFSKSLENTYYDKISSYSGEKVVFTGQEDKSHGRVSVSSVLIHNNVQTPIVYSLRQKDDKWVVYDVVIEGVSLILNYRTQFAQIIEKEKYAGLVKRLEEKVAKNEAVE